MVTEMVTPTDVSKFQRAYKKHFGIALEVFDARTKLELLVRQMELVYQPISVQQSRSINVNENNHEQSKPKPAAS